MSFRPSILFPSRDTGIPFSNPISRYSASSGASWGATVHPQASAGGSSQASSIMPHSQLLPQRFSSTEKGLSFLTMISMSFSLAYSISFSRVSTHSLIGAMTLMSGSRDIMPTSKRTWSLPLAVQPWAMYLAPSRWATSISFFTMSGLAIAVLRG
ncbi:hypothetical protein SDC9_195569 [bioreactor metagenome]|uniref:Uncharacterized protein n=1 Tax=bioreactor metagenome TaxID=1076179 RepID=A0A645I9E2_9ZZZZ